ncbi:MAG: carboxy terminal-processing peptidase [Flavobacteriaceae bacterium]
MTKFSFTILFFLTYISSYVSDFDNPSKDKLLIEIVSYVLNKGHYSPSQINDQFSEEVYKNFLDGVDSRHLFFIQSDIDFFDSFKFEIDDQIKTSKIEFFNLSHQRYLQRLDQVKSFYPSILSQSFDFSIDEKINLDFENTSYSESLSELKKQWRKFLKFNALGIYSNLKDEENRKKEINPEYDLKDDNEIEIETRKVLKEDMKYFFEARYDLNRNDYFSIYVNSIALQFDPHTSYFAPSAKDRFDQNISGKFEGIGARLTKRNQEVEIVDIISGGPVWRENSLRPGDKILKVSQINETPVDVVGMRLDDVIKLIKGPKGTQVILTVKKVDGSILDVILTRDIIELEEAFAKSTIIEKDNIRYGLINLPRFYVDFQDYGNRNAATDVKYEIQNLKKQDVQGIIIDLRNNGGGSLQTVVDMAGYFIEKGPIVQVKSTGGKKQILFDKDNQIEWNGALVLIVNEFSASASEILAAAFQDYRRGIVLGSKQTYGKGTVQNMIDLNKIISGNTYGDLGAMKLTTDKFYRINGGSTQLEGVKSDVIFPNRYSYIEVGEKDQENPLKWDKISPANYDTFINEERFLNIIEKSNKRLESNPFVKLIDEQAKLIKQRQENSEFTLNYESLVRQKEIENSESEKFKKLNEFSNTLSFYPTNIDFDKISNDSTLIKKRDRWEETLTKDIYIDEAVNILNDLNKVSISYKKVAQTIK